MKSYKDLEIYQMSFDLAAKVHQYSLTLPKYEMYEIGSQLRRSSQSIKDNIIEGYGRRNYKAEFSKFLTYAYASLLETISQLEMLKVLYKSHEAELLLEKYEQLGKQLFAFSKFVKTSWKTNNP